MPVSYPRFTVIIPQKNRAEYISYTLRTCMIQDYPNFEIIVSDDCSDDNSVEVIRSLAEQDKRIKLFAHDHHIGMRENFEFALRQVKPGYVMALGGDDGLVPGCIWRMYEIIKQTGRELLTWSTPYYVYPDFKGGKSHLDIRRYRKYEVRILKSEDFLNTIAKTFRYLVDECPMFYIKGVASTTLVNKVKSRTEDGCFYYCPTPDGFSGVVLAGEVEDYAFTNEPLSINGTTIKSQGRLYKKNDAESKKESLQFFEDSSRKTMHEELASQHYSPLITLMTADYLLTARDLPGWPGKFDSFSFEHLLKATFKMLETNPFENEVLVREMIILKAIAKQHNLIDLYNDLVNSTIRKIAKSNLYRGSSMTRRMITFDGQVFGINNIYEAALAVPFAYQAANKLTIPEWIKIYWRTLQSIVQRKRIFKTKLPVV